MEDLTPMMQAALRMGGEPWHGYGKDDTGPVVRVYLKGWPLLVSPPEGGVDPWTRHWVSKAVAYVDRSGFHPAPISGLQPDQFRQLADQMLDWLLAEARSG